MYKFIDIYINLHIDILKKANQSGFKYLEEIEHQVID